MGHAPGGWRGRPGAFPLAPSLTCLTKNLPSSLRLFSFLAAINRRGAAATSSKRCSMTAGPPPQTATDAPCFALRAPEPLRSPRRSCHQLRPQRKQPPLLRGHPERCSTRGGSTRRTTSPACDGAGLRRRPRPATPAPPPRHRKRGRPYPGNSRWGIRAEMACRAEARACCDGRSGDDEWWDSETEDSAMREKLGSL